MKAKEYLKYRQGSGSTEERTLADLAMHFLQTIEKESENQRRIFRHSESKILLEGIRLADHMIRRR